MDRSIYIALSGAVLQEKRMELLSDNLANVNTAGFKKQKAVFEDAMPNPFGPRVFALLDGIVTDMSQGVMENTGRRLDVAISGDGFFTVSTPSGERYTRDGSFTIAQDGTLVTREGHKVVGESGVIKLTSSDVVIDATGDILEKGASVGKLKLVSFGDASRLTREGGLFAAATGMKEAPISPDTQLEQGHIEISNVNPVKAMTSMIEASRSYETHAKMIQAVDDMTRKAIEEVGRV